MASLNQVGGVGLRMLAVGLSIAGVLLGGGPSWAAADAGRVALVIGQGAYRHLPPLPAAVSDARGMAAALDKLGFATELALDQDKVGLEQTMRRLAERTAHAELALFYYSGHALQLNRTNYLLPVDLDLEQLQDDALGAVDAVLALRLMQPASRARVAILDACRHSPLVGKQLKGNGGRTVAPGLAAMEAVGGPGTLVAFACRPGSLGVYGGGNGSLFTGALLETLPDPDLEVRQVLEEARRRVVVRSAGTQIPWDSSSLTEDLYLAAQPAPPPAPSGGSGVVPQAEVVFWQSIMASHRPEDFQDYLRQFPRGTFSGLAGRRIAELETKQPGVLAGNPARTTIPAAPVATVPPPPTAPPAGVSGPFAAPQTMRLRRSAEARVDPGFQAATLVTVPAGALVKVRNPAVRGDWLEIELGAGRTGWVPRELLADPLPADQANPPASETDPWRTDMAGPHPPPAAQVPLGFRIGRP